MRLLALGRMHHALRDVMATKKTAGLPCRTSDPDLWFSDKPAELKLARSLCGKCPLRKPCLDGAIERLEPWGIWGGEIFEGGIPVSRKRWRRGLLPRRSSPDQRAAPARARPVRLAEWLTGLTVRVLPAGHRDRYGEEFAAELDDLTGTGASWWRQLTYALRLVDRALVLRAELQQSAKSPAAP